MSNEVSIALYLLCTLSSFSARSESFSRRPSQHLISTIDEQVTPHPPAQATPQSILSNNNQVTKPSTVKQPQSETHVETAPPATPTPPPPALKAPVSKTVVREALPQVPKETPAVVPEKTPVTKVSEQTWMYYIVESCSINLIVGPYS